MDLLPIKIEQNRNFYYAEDGALYHCSGENVGGRDYVFHNNTEQDRKNFICHENIKVYPTGVLVEWDSNCYDVENEVDGYNLDDKNVSTQYADKEELFGQRRSKPELRRHYINKMFYNNQNELVFDQHDFEKNAMITTHCGELLVKLCESTVQVTDAGLGVKRTDIAVDCDQKPEEFHTYAELTEQYRKQCEDAEWSMKKAQEDFDWEERNEERLRKFGFNNQTLKTPHGRKVYRAFDTFRKISGINPAVASERN